MRGRKEDLEKTDHIAGILPVYQRQGSGPVSWPSFPISLLYELLLERILCTWHLLTHQGCTDPVGKNDHTSRNHAKQFTLNEKNDGGFVIFEVFLSHHENLPYSWF